MLLAFVVLLAVCWHLGVFWLERSRKVYGGPPLAEVLKLVELDLRETLKNTRPPTRALLGSEAGDAVV